MLFPDVTQTIRNHDGLVLSLNFTGNFLFDTEGRIGALVHGGSHPFFGIGVTSRPPAL